MHSFQPYPIELLELNPFTRIGKEGAIIASGSKKSSNLMTIGWGGIGVLWGKNVAFIFVRNSRYTKKFLDETKDFSLAFFTPDNKDALDYCGTHSGREGDKWGPSGLTPAYRHGIPYPDEAELVILCSALAAIPVPPETFLDSHIKPKWYSDEDYHMLYAGEIIEVMAR